MLRHECQPRQLASICRMEKKKKKTSIGYSEAIMQASMSFLTAYHPGLLGDEPAGAPLATTLRRLAEGLP